MVASSNSWKTRRKLEEEAVDSMVGRPHPLGDVMVGQPDLEPVQELIDFEQGDPGSDQLRAATQAELLPASFALHRPSKSCQSLRVYPPSMQWVRSPNRTSRAAART